MKNLNVVHSYPGSTPQGWSCSVCKMFVPFGVMHSCGGLPSASVGSTQSVDHRIAVALERIAAILEAMHERGERREL